MLAATVFAVTSASLPDDHMTSLKLSSQRVVQLPWQQKSQKIFGCDSSLLGYLLSADSLLCIFAKTEEFILLFAFV